MKNTFYCAATITFLFTVSACQKEDANFDASGVFEAREVVVSSQTAGQIIDWQIDEGVAVTADQVVGNIDCDDLALLKAQIEASKEALKLKRLDATPEIRVLEKQIASQEAQILALQTQYAVLAKERDRLSTLIKQEAAPTKQLDDVQGQMDVLQKQIATAQSQVSVLKEQIRSSEHLTEDRNRGIMSENSPLQSQINRIENQITHCKVINPIDGIVIAKYAEEYEVVGIAKPLYKVADLSEMILRAYVTGDQLASVKLSQQVKVLVDNGQTDQRTYDGTISWISEKAEFTPKTIQTKNERANLVYAVKVTVKSDGYLRIGMYGEIDW
ncbi:MAG TPA: HlyD family efflux transporter periplasmic adaptor subunit [Saprospiraceae bacterium]|nr:HlyD family efflux transporter periplasmic adaptor subunit [Saprospiraceae bacterium]